MPYWIDLVLDNDKGAPTYLQRASPSVIMEFRRRPDMPSPGAGPILPMKIEFNVGFSGKYEENPAGQPLKIPPLYTPGTEVPNPTVANPSNKKVVFVSNAGTSGGDPVQEIRIKLKSSVSHPPEGYAFDVRMLDDNDDWQDWDPRVVSK